MYTHLLVPIDDTALSAANLRTAIQLAKCFGAQVTFFHALRDWMATGEGSMLMNIDPGQFGEAALGDSNSILAKAVASGRAVGVVCNGASRVCDRPAEAIIDAVAKLQCDLIVMASRGSSGGISGWLHNSQTERVLRNAPVALLVTRVETSNPLKPSDRALGHIQDEHHSIAVVVQAMREVAQELRDDGTCSAPNVLEALLQYLNEFPHRVHHPKEELHLHKWLRIRDPDCSAILNEVEAQHVREGQLVESVAEALQLYRSGAGTGTGAGAALALAIDELVKAVFDHLNLEEARILPHALAVLTEPDWIEIAGAFAANDDPRYGDLTAVELRRMFTQIANRLPKSSVGT